MEVHDLFCSFFNNIRYFSIMLGFVTQLNITYKIYILLHTSEYIKYYLLHSIHS